MCFTISKHQALFKTYVPNGLWSRRSSHPKIALQVTHPPSSCHDSSKLPEYHLENPKITMKDPTTSKHRLKSSQISPFLLGFLKVYTPQPSQPSIWAKVKHPTESQRHQCPNASWKSLRSSWPVAVGNNKPQDGSTSKHRI